MARRNRREEDLERDDDPIASLLLEGPAPGPALTPTTWRTAVSDPLADLQDFRTFHPDQVYRDPLLTSGLPATTKQTRPRTRSLVTQTTFDAPRDVAICVRRKSRREVIFAKRKAGAGARARRRRNYWSNVKC